jgi:hypothetical protein
VGEQIENAPVGELAARDDRVRAGAREGLSGPAAIVSLCDLITVGREDSLKTLSDSRILFDQKDPLPGRRNGNSFRGRRLCFRRLPS